MTTPTQTEQAAPRCFIIMPMAPTVERYPQEHFQRVLAELIQPACEKAGFTPIYAKTSGASEIIMADVLRQLIETEMVVCDMSPEIPTCSSNLGFAKRSTSQSR